MSFLKSPFFWFILAVLTTAGLTALGPQEQSLGPNVRIVYLHGAWALTAEAVLALAAVTGLLGILTRSERLQTWSTALGRTGLFFLGNLSAAVIMGHAGQLERIVPERTAFPHCSRLFGDWGATSGGTHPAG